jgi:hypothetical protein
MKRKHYIILFLCLIVLTPSIGYFVASFTNGFVGLSTSFAVGIVSIVGAFISYIETE